MIPDRFRKLQLSKETIANLLDPAPPLIHGQGGLYYDVSFWSNCPCPESKSPDNPCPEPSADCPATGLRC